MRLFIAINFNDKIKNKILFVQNDLKKYVEGNFTKLPNVHLTLEFLGEIPETNLYKIEQTIKNVQTSKFTLTFDKIGCFNRNGEEIWWIGNKNNDKLINLQKSLNMSLINSGFELEQRKYKPHITIARHAKTVRKFDINALPKSIFTSKVDAYSLMLSEYKKELLTYTELFKVNLND